MALPRTIIDMKEMQSLAASWKQAQETIAFVPTMGALHAGHLELVKYAGQIASKVVVSIFVNPSQFGPNEDFAKYPRALREDLEKLSSLRVDAVFTPNASEMYPPGFQCWLENTGMSLDYCGPLRPGHFRGVQTIVLKLINVTRADHAVFGKKDYQQVRVIERMVRDLQVPTTIHPLETVREDDGLAMSSRNRYLNEADRQLALALPMALNATFDKFELGVRSRQELEKAFLDEIGKFPEFELDYVHVCNQNDLAREGDEVTEPSVILAAVKLGTVRLIDNLELG